MTTISDIQCDVEHTYAAERKDGFLRLDFLRTLNTFFAAEKILASDSTECLDSLPPWLLAELYSWIDTYRKEGCLAWVVPEVGDVDHSDLARRLAEVLPPPYRFGASLNLQDCEDRSPAGHGMRYFTYYLDAAGNVILHGLHRAYSATGALTESEYRHGELISVRAFDAKDQEA